jgi:hypothetical protein
MDITIDAIKEAVVKQPDLLKGITGTFKEQFLAGIQAEGMIVRTKEEDTAYLTNQLNVILPGKVDEKFKEKFKGELDAMDAEILAVTGIAKNPNEKTTDYVKRATKEHNAKGGDPVTKQRVTELEKMVKDNEDAYKKQLADKETEFFKSHTDTRVTSALDKVNIALPVHLKTDEEKQAYINQQKNLIKQGFLSGHTPKKDDQGNIIYYEGDKPLMNTKDGKPKDEFTIINEKYAAWFVPATHTVNGAGGGQGNGSPAGGFKSKDDVHNYLKANGYDATTNKYQEQFEKLTTEHKIAV